MERLGPDIAEAVTGAGRDQHGLVRLNDLLIVLKPDLGATCEHFQHFFDSMDVSRRTQASITELLEDAELPPTKQIGHTHLGQDALAPCLERLFSVFEDIHGGGLLLEEVGIVSGDAWQIHVAHAVVAAQLVGGSRTMYAPTLEGINEVGDLKGKVDVLLH